MKVRYNDVEFEFDIVPVLITAASRVNGFRKKEVLGRLQGTITLVRLRNPGPFGQVRVIRLCLKNVFEIAVAKP